MVEIGGVGCKYRSQCFSLRFREGAGGKSRMLAEGSIGCAKNSTMVYESSSSKLAS